MKEFLNRNIPVAVRSFDRLPSVATHTYGEAGGVVEAQNKPESQF